MQNKFLPLGSIVMLNGGSKRLMIIGYLPIDSTSKMYDYMGCMYPEGVLNSNQSIIFNHSDIKQIYSLGFSDDESKKFNEKLIELENNNK